MLVSRLGEGTHRRSHPPPPPTRSSSRTRSPTCDPTRTRNRCPSRSRNPTPAHTQHRPSAPAAPSAAHSHPTPPVRPLLPHERRTWPVLRWRADSPRPTSRTPRTPRPPNPTPLAGLGPGDQPETWYVSASLGCTQGEDYAMLHTHLWLDGIDRELGGSIAHGGVCRHVYPFRQLAIPGSRASH
jgi:hypothetical protein